MNGVWTLARLQEFREHTEISNRLADIEREVKARELLGDIVYRFMGGEDSDAAD